MGDGRKKGLEPGVDFEDGFLVECHCRSADSIRNEKKNAENLRADSNMRIIF
jgi:hypothetical protein